MKWPRGLGGAATAVTGVFGRAANQVIALSVTLLAARWLTPISFGEFSIAAALATLSRAMLYAGAFEYLLKAPKGEEAYTECLVVNVALASLMAVLLALLSIVARPIFHSREVGILLLAIAPSSLLSAAANWQESQLLRRGRLKSYYGVTTFAEIFAALATVSLIVLGFGLSALIVQIYCRLFMLVIVYRILQTPTWSRHFSVAKTKTVAVWSIARYGATVVNFLGNYSADILLGIFLSPFATGIFRASHRMVTGVSDLINNPTRLTAVTIFSRGAADGVQSASRWPGIAAAAALLGWTALCGLAAISNRAVPMVLGPRWAAAGPIVAILCAQRAFSLIDGVTGPLLVAYSHVRQLLAIQSVIAIVGVGLLAVIAPHGVLFAAVGVTLTAAGSTVVLVILTSRLFPEVLRGVPRVLPVALAPALLSGAAAFLCGRVVDHSELAPTVIISLQVGAGMIAFLASVVVLRRSVLDVVHALTPPLTVVGLTEADEASKSVLVAS